MIEKGLQEPMINVGNLKAQRDFLDVRDAVSAYHCIVNKGKEGQIYNVCSGKKYKISDLLDMLISLSTVPEITVNIDRDKFRAIDVEIIYGSNSKLRAHTGWKSRYSIKKSLKDTIDYWRENVGPRV